MRLVVVLLFCCGLAQAETLDELFARAEYDPSAMVPLVEQAGRALAALPPAEAVRMGDRLQPYLQRVYFSGESFAGMERLGLIGYAVRSGDTFGAIARAHGVGSEYLQAINPRVRPSAMQIGQELKVLDCSAEAPRIYVWRSRFRCMLMRPVDGGLQLMAVWPVGVGKPGRQTPLGVSHIEMKVRDPVWTDPDTKEIFQPGDPGNVLGGYWIRVNAGADARFKGIGFHGYTGAPADDWLEQEGSRGCIRMLKADIDQLYGIVRPGVKVAVLE